MTLTCHKVEVVPVWPSPIAEQTIWLARCDECTWRSGLLNRMDSAMADAYEHMRDTGVAA